MIINKYVKSWCDEDYDVRKEDFFMSNAEYVIERQWASGGVKNAWIAIIPSMLSFLFNSSESILVGILYAFSMTALLTICFWFYAMRDYDANSVSTSRSVYVMSLIFFWVLRRKMNLFVLFVFTLWGMLLYFKLSWINPIKFRKIKKNIKEKIAEEEKEEDTYNKEAYEKWKEGYKAFRYGLPEFEVPKEDPMLAQVRKLFEGYDKDKQMLKTRYRQLAKMYHPDKGGDTNLFQCIINIYEELSMVQ